MQLDFKEYARALGSIKTEKKAQSSRKNLLKAQKASTTMAKEKRIERAKKAASARWSKASQNATKTPKTKTESK